MRPNTAQEGFSLLELMIALAIAGILTGLAVPSFKTLLSNHRLEGAAQRLVSDLRLARQTAIAEGIPTGIQLNPHEESYFLEKGIGLQPSPFGFLDLKDPREGFPGIDLVDSTKGNHLIFFPKGTTNSWTTITLENRNGKQQKITLIGTGRVKRIKP
ncbi:MAG TPA: GspH/FimT family pseudopilin [Nitrospiria bacterium]|jgi:prepilin-type N-terminal cleavage/methylation domain-containing protein